MKVRYLTKNGKLNIEFEAVDTKAIFDELASFNEILEQEKCEACGSENLKFSKRLVDKYVYRELFCADCSSKLSFGQHQKDTSLFPSRRDKDGNIKGVKGWHKWTPDDYQEPPQDEDVKPKGKKGR